MSDEDDAKPVAGEVPIKIFIVTDSFW